MGSITGQLSTVPLYKDIIPVGLLCTTTTCVPVFLMCCIIRDIRIDVQVSGNIVHNHKLAVHVFHEERLVTVNFAIRRIIFKSSCLADRSSSTHDRNSHESDNCCRHTDTNENKYHRRYESYSKEECCNRAGPSPSHWEWYTNEED